MKAKQTKQRKPDENLTPQQKVRREVIAWTWVILIFLLINAAVGQARVIPSESMKNTLLVGDHLIMSRFGYDVGSSVARRVRKVCRSRWWQHNFIYRIVISGESSYIIKLVIGLPGETMDVHNCVLWIYCT